MENFKIENLSFTYPGAEKKTLDCVNLTVHAGEFITICGKSGCGKTTLLRMLKSALAPYGETEGEILFCGKPLSVYDTRAQAAKIGFVMQNPDNQIVTDKVWHELAFGLESLGCATPEIRTRVSEMASFFGIQTWFYKNVTELSGGQKQLLNLASVMVMQPEVLILDEPTGQLDPIAAQEFLKTLEKINRELGIAVILTEHRLEDALPMSDRVVVMDAGRIIADAAPREAAALLKDINHDMYAAMPAPMRIYGAVEHEAVYPLTVREGRTWLEAYAQSHPLKPEVIPEALTGTEPDDTVIEVSGAWFRYAKNAPDVIKGLDLKIGRGELFAIVGGNGTGKTTALSLMAGLHRPYRGEVFINGKSVSKTENLYHGVLGVLPQNPQSVFVKNTVQLDLEEMLSEQKLTESETAERVLEAAKLCRLETLLARHPYDLSGGEQQRAALAKVLLQTPQILLLDEPTKGLDAHFKAEFSDILADLKTAGVTVVMVSHDIEFCAEYADRCAMFFDGAVTSVGCPREFFAGKNFYTTAANRMARTSLPKAVLAEDIIRACGVEVKKRERPQRSVPVRREESNVKPEGNKRKKRSLLRKGIGSLFLALFVFSSVLSGMETAQLIHINQPWKSLLPVVGFAAVIGALFCFFPNRELQVTTVQQPRSDRKLTKRTLTAALLILLAIPLTIYIGIYFFGDRKYYFISLLIILETMLPFCMVFEHRKPQARELIVISVMCAVAVAGRAAFFALPQFKPVIALVMISGVCFGGESGFLVGAVTGFVSNFFYGQGPWTPWQMFAFGIIGFLSGILFKKGLLRKTRLSLCIFGFAATFVIFGGIMNPASVIMAQTVITKEMIVTAYLMGLPLDLLHALSTAIFLWFIAEPMLSKIERVKVKYGLIVR